MIGNFVVYVFLIVLAVWNEQAVYNSGNSSMLACVAFNFSGDMRVETRFEKRSADA